MLFSYPNVWNTCLLILRQRGYQLHLLGYSDDSNFTLSQCTWNAEKDGLKFRAANPIELLGLVAIRDHQSPTADTPYWWRIEGHDVVKELELAWRNALESKSKDDSPSRRYSEACGVYCEGRFVEAASVFAELVKIEHAGAATYLGEMYLNGRGVPRDRDKGLELLRLATSWGSAIAAFNLGALHRSGDGGVPIDAAASRRYFILARDLGCEIPVEPFLK